LKANEKYGIDAGEASDSIFSFGKNGIHEERAIE
jgi:hypothetical protein